MDELRKHHLYVEVEDDIKFGDGPQHAYKHPKYFESNMVQFAHSAAVNIYMAKRWRRAVLPKHPKDQFLSPWQRSVACGRSRPPLRRISLYILLHQKFNRSVYTP